MKVLKALLWFVLSLWEMLFRMVFSVITVCIIIAWFVTPEVFSEASWWEILLATGTVVGTVLIMFCESGLNNINVILPRKFVLYDTENNKVVDKL